MTTNKKVYYYPPKVCRNNSCGCGRSFKDSRDLKRHVGGQERSKHSLLLRNHPAYEKIDWDACALAGIYKTQIDSMKIGSCTKLYWVCTDAPCGCEHSMFKSPMHLIVWKRSCQECANNVEIVCIHKSLAHKKPEFTAQWHPTKNGDRKAESTSVSSSFRATWVCEKGHEWSASPASRTSHDSGCPDCSATGLEQTIARVLTKMGIDFKTQVRIAPEQNRGGYDIGFTDSKVLIEVDGGQHFRENPYFADKCNMIPEELFEYTVKRDVWKELLARKHGYHLLRIPYTHGSQAAMTEAVKFFLLKLEQHQGIKQFEMKVNGQLYIDSRKSVEV